MGRAKKRPQKRALINAPHGVQQQNLTLTSVRPKKGANLNMSFQTDAVFPEDTMMIVKNQVVKSISATKRRHQSNLPRFSADRDPEVLMNDTRLSTTTELC